MYPYKILNHEFWMLPEKCLFRESDKTLIMADWHLGKAGHFRKNGVPVSKAVHYHDMDRLISTLKKYKASKLLILGDLYHSEENLEWSDLTLLANKLKQLTISLVAGNHDRWGLKKLPPSFKLYPNKLMEEGIIYSHEPLSATEIPQGSFNISGHLHPGVTLRGKGRQALRLPCFLVQPKCMILPAFSEFTGKAKITPSASDQVFVVTDKEVLRAY